MKPHIIINDLNDFAFAELMATHLPERASLMLSAAIPLHIAAAVFAKLPPSRALIIDPNTTASNAIAITNMSKEGDTLGIMANFELSTALSLVKALKPNRSILLDDEIKVEMAVAIARVMPGRCTLTPHDNMPVPTLIALAEAMNPGAIFKLPLSKSLTDCLSVVMKLQPGVILFLDGNISSDVSIRIHEALPKGCILQMATVLSPQIVASLGGRSILGWPSSSAISAQSAAKPLFITPTLYSMSTPTTFTTVSLIPFRGSSNLDLSILPSMAAPSSASAQSPTLLVMPEPPKLTRSSRATPAQLMPQKQSPAPAAAASAASSSKLPTLLTPARDMDSLLMPPPPPRLPKGTRRCTFKFDAEERALPTFSSTPPMAQRSHASEGDAVESIREVKPKPKRKVQTLSDALPSKEDTASIMALLAGGSSPMFSPQKAKVGELDEEQIKRQCKR